MEFTHIGGTRPGIIEEGEVYVVEKMSARCTPISTAIKVPAGSSISITHWSNQEADFGSMHVRTVSTSTTVAARPRTFTTPL
jgi:hypothetical protein